ncbi:oxidoreductase domain protein [Methylocaldum marinum]|uniref:Oxidoreductase domain protein n=1 Tax=Methylocaldum marinum TaxID=1432792 RepID=A0A250KYM3_9GAMM|nr:Gfo/Idh/MocA family oxidoreductase [Methylocaldum marinum]BBA36735.1 oxidoreductase domain protein [Methylocaldum marinum]
MSADPTRTTPPEAPIRRPRLGFLGVGWIGRNRMAAVADQGCAEIVAIADPTAEALREAKRLAPGAMLSDRPESLFDSSVDGIVIATPSAAHARQATAALERGLAVFCQKPLARTGQEAQGVVVAARRADRLLGVDLSYRHVRGMAEIREAVRRGELGEIYAMDLTFHNAYGPDKPWFYDMAQAGGGCVMDLGIHLVDLALWMLDFPAIETVSSRLYAGGKCLAKPVEQVEDYAVAEIGFRTGAVARIACSWRLSAGRDAVIDFSFYGTRGAASLRNVDGSFHDFVVERYNGRQREIVAGYPDAWGGRALIHWVRQLRESGRFAPEARQFVEVAETLDRIYQR